jgi:hypothetical protein
MLFIKIFTKFYFIPKKNYATQNTYIVNHLLHQLKKKIEHVNHDCFA